AELIVPARVVALGVALLLGPSLIQGARLVLSGLAPHVYARGAVPGMLAEASLLPLSAVVIYVYRPDRPLGFVLTGLTYLLVNYVFNRLSHASEGLRRRLAGLDN